MSFYRIFERGIPKEKKEKIQPIYGVSFYRIFERGIPKEKRRKSSQFMECHSTEFLKEESPPQKEGEIQPIYGVLSFYRIFEEESQKKKKEEIQSIYGKSSQFGEKVQPVCEEVILHKFHHLSPRTHSDKASSITKVTSETVQTLSPSAYAPEHMGRKPSTTTCAHNHATAPHQTSQFVLAQRTSLATIVAPLALCLC